MNYGPRENIYKRYISRGSIQNTQRTFKIQLHKNKTPDLKMGQRI